MTDTEWEALCDGCGRCCLNKLEDPDTGHVALTRIACRLLDNETCQCSQYVIRQEFVPECIRMTARHDCATCLLAAKHMRLQAVARGRNYTRMASLTDGHSAIVHDAGISVQGWTIPEFEVPEEEWEDHIIED